MKRILVVDDDPVMRELLIETLRDEYVVSAATNGAEALDSMHRFLPDAVVLDMNMPVMDGRMFLTTCRTMHLGADVPVMVVSGEPTACQDGMQLGAQACLPKPFDVHRLATAVSQLFAPGTRSGQ